MPTREEMIRALQGDQRPTREQMIAKLQEVDKLTPSNRLYDVAEQGLIQGLQFASPVLETIGNISKKGSELATRAFESSPMGAVTRLGQSVTGAIIPEEIKQARVSQVLPQLYSESGAGLALQRGGALDPTASEVYKGAEQMVVDPLNLLPAVGGGFGKLAQTVKAGLGKGIKASVEVAGSALTGVPKHVIKNYKKFAPEIEKLRLSGTGIESVASEVNQNVANTIKTKITQTGRELGNEISQAGGAVDINKVKSSFDKAINDAMESFMNNPSAVNEQKVLQLENVQKKFFATDKLTPSGAFELQQDLKDIMAFTPKTLEGKLSGMSQSERLISKSADDAYNEINNQLNTLTEGASSKLKNKYKEFINMRDKLEPIAGGDAQKTFNALKTLKRPDRKIIKAEIKKIDKELGTNITDSVDLLETYAYLGEPSWNPLSGGGVTSTTRTLTAGALGSLAGGGFNPVTAAIAASTTSPAMLKQLLNLGLTVDEAMSVISKGLPNLPKVSPAMQIGAYQGLSQLGQQQ